MRFFAVAHEVLSELVVIVIVGRHVTQAILVQECSGDVVGSALVTVFECLSLTNAVSKRSGGLGHIAFVVVIVGGTTKRSFQHFGPKERMVDLAVLGQRLLVGGGRVL